MGVSPLWSLPFKHSHFPPNHDYGRKSNSLNSGYQWYKKKSWYGFICTLIPTFSYAGLHGFSSKPTCEIRTFEVQNTYSFHTEGLSMPPRCLGQLSETFTLLGCRKHRPIRPWTFWEERMETFKPQHINHLGILRIYIFSIPGYDPYRLYLEWFPMVIGSDPSSQITPFLVESVAKLALDFKASHFPLNLLSNGGFGHSTVSWNTRKKVMQAHQRILETGVMYIEIWFKMLLNMCCDKHIDIILKYWEIWHAVTLKTKTDSFWFQISKAGVQAGEVSLCILHKPNKKKLVFLSSDFYKYHIEDAGNHPKQALRQS